MSTLPSGEPAKKAPWPVCIQNDEGKKRRGKAMALTKEQLEIWERKVEYLLERQKKHRAQTAVTMQKLIERIEVSLEAIHGGPLPVKYSQRFDPQNLWPERYADRTGIHIAPRPEAPARYTNVQPLPILPVSHWPAA